MNNSGQIITFYSFKGGSGRTMTLANVAWLLASNGKRVLAIDWDLEALGLPQFFLPFLNGQSFASSAGLMDFFIDYAATALLPPEHLPSLKGRNSRVNAIDWRQCVQTLKWEFPNHGQLDMISAGAPGGSYAAQLSGFNWERFYSRLGGYSMIEQFKHELKDEYDYVLIDSRTETSDTAGICTLQMPD